MIPSSFCFVVLQSSEAFELDAFSFCFFYLIFYFVCVVVGLLWTLQRLLTPYIAFGRWLLWQPHGDHTSVSSHHGAMLGLMAVVDVDASEAENRDLGMSPWEDNGDCDAPYKPIAQSCFASSQHVQKDIRDVRHLRSRYHGRI